MAKAPRYYEDNETETYGIIPNLGEFLAYYGNAAVYYASHSSGVRPAFAIS